MWYEITAKLYIYFIYLSIHSDNYLSIQINWEPYSRWGCYTVLRFPIWINLWYFLSLWRCPVLVRLFDSLGWCLTSAKILQCDLFCLKDKILSLCCREYLFSSNISLFSCESNSRYSIVSLFVCPSCYFKSVVNQEFFKR